MMNQRLKIKSLLDEAVKFQKRNSIKLILNPPVQDFRIICGVDASFDDKKVYTVACLFSYHDSSSKTSGTQELKSSSATPGGVLTLIEEVEDVQDIKYPYVATFFACREGPALIDAINKLNRKPDVILVDGHGIAHPRGFGIASYVGFVLETPTIGCAKTKLIGEYEEPGIRRGSLSKLIFNKRIVGAVLRTKTGVKPVFVSPGNLIDLATSIKVVLAVSRYRIPEPLRIADIKSKELKNYGVKV